MPSPFPGMDPFLEHPNVFPDLHDSMAVYLRESLQARLPEPYYADVGNRVWVEMSQRTIGPDVKVLRPNGAGNGGQAAGGGGVAVATLRTPPIVVHVPHDERRETFVEIYTRQGGHERLVTHIEILSLSNKTPGEHGRELYQTKQREILNSKTHLVEIDLLRAGTHSTAVPLDRVQARTGRFDYHVCVHQFDNLEDYFVYPVQLPDRLPEIAVPLLPSDGAVVLDLQAVLDRCYDTGPYRRRVRYADNPVVPPLDAERSAWVTHLLREKGLLPESRP